MFSKKMGYKFEIFNPTNSPDCRKMHLKKQNFIGPLSGPKPRLLWALRVIFCRPTALPQASVASLPQLSFASLTQHYVASLQPEVGEITTYNTLAGPTT